mmetsp:Transcript_8226/g.34531  ORF Transcript_8226/g.34531 Transcript_8226/m.34531 type:complete len:255 (+) Transcript_8226:27-791(+)
MYRLCKGLPLEETGWGESPYWEDIDPADHESVWGLFRALSRSLVAPYHAQERKFIQSTQFVALQQRAEAYNETTQLTGLDEIVDKMAVDAAYKRARCGRLRPVGESDDWWRLRTRLLYQLLLGMNRQTALRLLDVRSPGAPAPVRQRAAPWLRIAVQTAAETDLLLCECIRSDNVAPAKLLDIGLHWLPLLNRRGVPARHWMRLAERVCSDDGDDGDKCRVWRWLGEAALEEGMHEAVGHAMEVATAAYRDKHK